MRDPCRRLSPLAAPGALSAARSVSTRQVLRAALALVTLALLVPAPRAQVPEPRRLAEGVHLLSGGPDGNVLVVDGEDARLVVDGWSPARIDPLLAALDALPGPPLRFVVNTHFHEDHRGLNATLAARGATVISHQATREYMTRTGFVQELGFTMHAADAATLPHVVTPGDLALHLGGRDVDLIHLPAAHTGGDLAVHIPDAKVLHTGDVFEPEEAPFLDAWHGGTLQGMVDACKRLARLADAQTIIVPGHGAPMDDAELGVYATLLDRFRKQVALATADVPQDEDEAQAALIAFMDSDPLSHHASWSPGGRRRLAAIAWLEATGLWEPPAPVDDEPAGG